MNKKQNLNRCRYCNEIKFKESHKEEDCCMKNYKEEFSMTKKEIRDFVNNFGKNIGKCKYCGCVTYSKKVKLCSYHEKIRDRTRIEKQLIMD